MAVVRSEGPDYAVGMRHRVCLRGGALALALLAPLASAASGAPQDKLTRLERKGLNALVARVLEKDFKLVPVHAPDGTLRVGLAVRAYTKSATDKGVRVDPYWSTEWTGEIRSWSDLKIAVTVAPGFCGGQGRALVVTISSSRSGTPVKVYAVFAGESLARLDYMDLATCME